MLIYLKNEARNVLNVSLLEPHINYISVTEMAENPKCNIEQIGVLYNGVYYIRIGKEQDGQRFYSDYYGEKQSKKA